METAEYRKLRKEFLAELRKASGHIATARLFMNSGDLQRAYEEAEKVQFAGYEAKDVLGKLVR